MKNNLSKISFDKFIDSITTEYHAKLEEELPKLNQFTKKIHRVHREDYGTVLGPVEQLFNELKSILDNHIKIEKESIFPLIQLYVSNPTEELLQDIINAVKEFEHIYKNIESILKELKDITSDYENPREACYTCNLTLERLKNLHYIVLEYIDLEKSILSINI